MYINKGKDKYMILDISELEIQIIRDALSMGMVTISNILTSPIDKNKPNGKRRESTDSEIAVNIGVSLEKAPEFRITLIRNFKIMDTHFKKINDYVAKPQG